VAVAVTLAIGRAGTVDAAEGAGLTLWQQSFAADVVAHARIVHPQWEIAVGEPPARWPVVEARSIEILKGDLAPGRLTFARDGQESPAYVAGQEVLIFLRAIEQSDTLRAAAIADTVPWASFPGPIETVTLTHRNREAYLAAARGYIAITAMPASPGQTARLRTLTLEMLTSPEPALARSALRDLALAGDAPLITKQEAGRLGRLVFDPAVPIETRIGVLRALERRGLIFGPTAWARLVRETRGSDRLTAIGAARGHHSKAVNQELAKLLDERDRTVALAAAEALGSLGNHGAVDTLLRALDTPDPARRETIVHALGDIRTQSARQALDLVAARHPDAATRRAAFGEALLLARRHGTTMAPMTGQPSEGQTAAGGAAATPRGIHR
jgi:hypothetical protein